MNWQLNLVCGPSVVPSSTSLSEFSFSSSQPPKAMTTKLNYVGSKIVKILYLNYYTYMIHAYEHTNKDKYIE